jgi:hypothetical protein
MERRNPIKNLKLPMGPHTDQILCPNSDVTSEIIVNTELTLHRRNPRRSPNPRRKLMTNDAKACHGQGRRPRDLAAQLPATSPGPSHRRRTRHRRTSLRVRVAQVNDRLPRNRRQKLPRTIAPTGAIAATKKILHIPWPGVSLDLKLESRRGRRGYS